MDAKAVYTAFTQSAYSTEVSKMKHIQSYAVAQVRLDPNRVKKVEQMKRQTSLTTSQLIRAMIDATEITPAQIVVAPERIGNAGSLRQDNAEDL